MSDLRKRIIARPPRERCVQPAVRSVASDRQRAICQWSRSRRRRRSSRPAGRSQRSPAPSGSARTACASSRRHRSQCRARPSRKGAPRRNRDCRLDGSQPRRPGPCRPVQPRNRIASPHVSARRDVRPCAPKLGSSRPAVVYRATVGCSPGLDAPDGDDRTIGPDGKRFQPAAGGGADREVVADNGDATGAECRIKAPVASEPNKSITRPDDDPAVGLHGERGRGGAVARPRRPAEITMLWPYRSGRGERPVKSAVRHESCDDSCAHLLAAAVGDLVVAADAAADQDPSVRLKCDRVRATSVGEAGHRPAVNAERRVEAAAACQANDSEMARLPGRRAFRSCKKRLAVRLEDSANGRARAP